MQKVNIKLRLNKKFVVINRIRLCIVYFLISVFISLFFDFLGLYWKLSVCALFFSFIIVYFYIAQYYHSFSYVVLDHYVIINSGVVCSKRIVLNKSLITKISLYQGVLQKIFNAKSVLLLSPGIKTYFPCVNEKDLKYLLEDINLEEIKQREEE